MNNKRIVVALGRNAFGETFPEQQTNVKKAACAIADLVEAKYQVVITHSNGPQVGTIQTAMAEFSRLDTNNQTVAPMSVCGAMSQGYIGYDLQNSLREELLNRGIQKPVATVLTQVEVDPADPAFQNPSKPIGTFMTEEEAEEMRRRGNCVMEDAGRGWRRCVASPKPKAIVEIETIRTLMEAGQVVIGCGGGGIPVYRPLPKFPAVTRDIAVVCAESVTVGALEDCIRRGAKGLLKKVELFDIYRGIGVAPGSKSVAFSLTLRADDRSLTGEEADEDVKSILALLEAELGAKLR